MTWFEQSMKPDRWHWYCLLHRNPENTLIIWNELSHNISTHWRGIQLPTAIAVYLLEHFINVIPYNTYHRRVLSLFYRELRTLIAWSTWAPLHPVQAYCRNLQGQVIIRSRHMFIVIVFRPVNLPTENCLSLYTKMPYIWSIQFMPTVPNILRRYGSFRRRQLVEVWIAFPRHRSVSATARSHSNRWIGVI